MTCDFVCHEIDIVLAEYLKLCFCVRVLVFVISRSGKYTP